MTESESRSGLSRQAREFVGVGASVGAGVSPVRDAPRQGRYRSWPGRGGAAGRHRGGGAGERGRVGAHGAVWPTAAGCAGDGRGSGRHGSRCDACALGAAIAANSMPNIERYLTEAAEFGVSRDELAEAVHLAHEVQGNAARSHARLTARLLDEPPPATQTAATQAPGARESAAEESRVPLPGACLYP